MNIDDRNGTTVLHRTSEEQPTRNLWSILIGRPLATADAPHETIGKAIGLAVFASDALSSTAYATQEIMTILAIAGTAAFGYVFPISICIVGLLAIVTVSYYQTIHAYPRGGGSFIVSRDNLGQLPAMVSAASLLIGYILTVAVSISSGVAQIVSAFPEIYDFRVWIAVGLVGFIMVINLRGVRESGLIFALPTYFFVFTMFLTLIVGFFRYINGTLGYVAEPPEIEGSLAIQGVTAFLLIRAFSSGTTALTGIEAISDGIPAFREPKSKNAATTLVIMATLLSVMLLGISFLSAHIRAVPSQFETVISQLVRTVYGERNLFYILSITATTVILVMGANTAFADFPRLSNFAAIDGFLPRQLSQRGSRLVYSRGIATLAFVSALLIFVFQASVTRLIPLYAIGVFLSFTLSQAGMAHRWWKIGHLAEGVEVKERSSTLRFQPGWQFKMVVNSFGALMTLTVAFLFGISKFADGAWIVIIIIPALVGLFALIHRHYTGVAKKLSMDNYESPVPRIVRNRVLLPIGGVHRGTLAALRYARTLSDDLTAVHISIDPEETQRIHAKWEQWGDGVRLVIIESSYRRFLEPLLDYIDEIYQKRQPNETITIVVPQFVSRQKMANVLHTNTAAMLRNELMFYKGIVVTNIPYLID